MKRFLAFAFAALLITPSAYLAAAEFVNIGANLLARNVSADGRYVVGVTSDNDSANGRAFRWSRESGLQMLGTLANGRSIATDVSTDGSVVVGGSTGSTGATEPFMWTEGNGMTGLGTPAGFSSSSAAATTDDGNAIVGSTTSFPWQAFLWTDQHGTDSLGVPNGMSGFVATDISSDGSVVVGHGNLAGGNGREPFIWDVTNGFEDLGPLPSGWEDTLALNVSADGTTVLGLDSSSDGVGRPVFRWNREEGIQQIPGLPTVRNRGRPGDVSADGSIIVGSFDPTDVDGDGLAFVWDAQNGTRALRDVLIAEHGFGEHELTELERLRVAPLFSADATTIVGWNENEMGLKDSWAIFLDKPLVSFGPSVLLPGDYNNNGTVEQADLDLVLLHWGDDASAVPDTWTNDLPTGTIDQDELDAVLLNWGNASTAGITTSAVPEPSCIVLVALLAVAAALANKRGRESFFAAGRSRLRSETTPS